MTRLEVTEQLVVEQAFKLVQAQERIAELEDFMREVANHAQPGWELRSKAKVLLAKGGKE